ncbi:unnamed protein product [Ambrosiozyma monospora]|uniref:Unnamed protein product n=1 Tax=Ambrosiozyma monospora TaxID=43982 RepID=A0ACB5T4Z2_AMBMO|nr:unnamed protein product [Ambrosiozyma monospora]
MLDLSQYCCVSPEEQESGGRVFGGHVYQLFAVVCHIGSVNTGHYISMVKNREGLWFKFDDATVTMVSQDEVLNSRAYLLFYIINDIS